MLGHLERNILFVILSCSFVSSLALALFVMTRPAPPAVECYLQFLNQSPSDPVILEAAFVGNDIANGLETKEVAFFDFLRFPET
jgi:hypothetical protein